MTSMDLNADSTKGNEEKESEIKTESNLYDDCSSEAKHAQQNEE